MSASSNSETLHLLKDDNCLISINEALDTATTSSPTSKDDFYNRRRSFIAMTLILVALLGIAGCNRYQTTLNSGMNLDEASIRAKIELNEEFPVAITYETYVGSATPVLRVVNEQYTDSIWDGILQYFSWSNGMKTMSNSDSMGGDNLGDQDLVPSQEVAPVPEVSSHGAYNITSGNFLFIT